MWEVSGYNRVAPQWAIHYSWRHSGPSTIAWPIPAGVSSRN
ncbi:hypothetical protein LTSEMON_3417 [Salmonella enterica subsp. enterica serovar Montevideo str. S5-403]|uniref:Uncharacterized protein n=1 Tax=Salmonella enterica subsp. enterica serovar Montevideo str. S5-403 TaxID=913242 RepID=G5Q5H7_SALMO|nr:hypothetical protein LTSEMON_3417 [Salmonella enterica subsp. enterica serovar Montevideo str. S5-403]